MHVSRLVHFKDMNNISIIKGIKSDPIKSIQVGLKPQTPNLPTSPKRFNLFPP